MANAMNERDDKSRSTGSTTEENVPEKKPIPDGTQGGGTNDGRSNNGRNLSQEDRSKGGQAAAARNERDNQGRFSSDNR